MMRFACANCSMDFTTSVGVGTEVVCPNCNTRQVVPSTAVPLTPEEERNLEKLGDRAASFRASYTPTIPPHLRLSLLHKQAIDLLALVTGWAIVLCGPWAAIHLWNETGYGRISNESFLYILLWGTFVVSWGLGLLYLRHALRHPRR
jgi:DNA-directed RNA polymerase subunit RPC12/RpoP